MATLAGEGACFAAAGADLADGQLAVAAAGMARHYAGELSD